VIRGLALAQGGAKPDIVERAMRVFFRVSDAIVAEKSTVVRNTP
jgi:hypothetical protein